ncbi:MAG: glycosyltransferase [Vulcanimicrobiaceae bacterium]
MKLALISAKYPYGPKEAFLDVELRALAPLLESVTVFPTSPPDSAPGFEAIPAGVQRLGLASAATFRGALRALRTRPRAALGAVLALLGAPYPLGVKLKNLAVIPLGLAVGDAVRRGRFDHVHAYWLSTPATVAYLAASVSGLPWSSTAHRWDIYENNAGSLKLRSARFVRAISQRGRSDLLARYAAGGAPRVEIVHVGVRVPAAAPSAAVQHSPFALACIANLVAEKGHADLFRALAALRAQGLAVRCDVVGDGPLRASLEGLAKELELADTVRFRGSMPHASVLSALRSGSYDALALTSPESAGGAMEGIPVALMEAMASGVPVVATDSGSVRELVDDRCGRLVPQGDVEAIADALAALIRDPDLRRSLAEAAFAKVGREFDVAALAPSLAALLTA